MRPVEATGVAEARKTPASPVAVSCCSEFERARVHGRDSRRRATRLPNERAGERASERACGFTEHKEQLARYRGPAFGKCMPCKLPGI